MRAFTETLPVCGVALALLLAGCSSGGTTATAPDTGRKVVQGDASIDGVAVGTSDATWVDCPTCVGAAMPTWELADFQPKSAGYGKTYGLSAFKGKVTVVALLASW